MTRWATGNEKIEQSLKDGDLQKVEASRDQADRLIDQAFQHLNSAATLKDSDPEGAYALLYDAARKALVACLENQGLRPTSRGGHIATIEAVRAQLDSILVGILRPCDRMRRTRRAAEYPPSGSPIISQEQVEEDLPKAKQIVEKMEQVLDQMDPY